MACVLMPQFNFLYGYFCCQLPEDTIDVEMTVWTMTGIHMFKRDHSTQVISCRPWTSRLCPYQSLARKMKAYFELKDQVFDLPCPSPTYPKRPNMPPPQRAQASRNKVTKESKKRSRNHQANKRQYKARLIEKPLVLPWVSVTTATPPALSNPESTPTPWPSTASANLFVTRSWPMLPNKEDNPMPVPEGKQTMKGLDLSKFKNPPARKIITSHTAPSVTKKLHHCQ